MDSNVLNKGKCTEKHLKYAYWKPNVLCSKVKKCVTFFLLINKPPESGFALAGEQG